MRTPRQDGFRMPAEWEYHSRCWMAWPGRESLWGDGLEAARDGYAEVAKAISAFEPVTMLVEPDSLTEASVRCVSGVACLPMEMDDAWIRDSGPSFLLSPAGELAAVDWIFNAWGLSYRTYDHDAELASQIIDYLEVRRYQAPLVTEGGALHVDGEGTLLAVESSIATPNRNPRKDRAEIERLLLDYSGSTKVIWLPHGLLGDESDGHIDRVACFAAPGTILTVATEDRDNHKWARLQAHLEVLRTARDAGGRDFKIITLPLPQRKGSGKGEARALSYVNFYLANGGVILPGFDDPADDQASDIISGLFPTRREVRIPGPDILKGIGGGIHSITQQQPARPPVGEKPEAPEAEA